MVRVHAKKGLRAVWSEESLQRAVVAVTMGKLSKKKAARDFGLPRPTLIRRLKQLEVKGTAKMLGRTPTLNEDEEELVKIIIDMENRLYGLTPKDVRKLVFDYCKANNIILLPNISYYCAILLNL